MAVDYEIPGEQTGKDVKLAFKRKGKNIGITVNGKHTLFTFMDNGKTMRHRNIPGNIGIKVENSGKPVIEDEIEIIR